MCPSFAVQVQGETRSWVNTFSSDKVQATGYERVAVTNLSKDIDKVAGITYLDILRATLSRSDPKEFLFFNRNATGKPAARGFVNRLKERTVDRDAAVSVKTLQTQLKAIKKWGRRAPADLEDHPAHPDRQRRQRPDGALCALGGHAPSHPRLQARDLPRLRPRRHLPVPRPVRPRRLEFLDR